MFFFVFWNGSGEWFTREVGPPAAGSLATAGKKEQQKQKSEASLNDIAKSINPLDQIDVSETHKALFMHQQKIMTNIQDIINDSIEYKDCN